MKTLTAAIKTLQSKQPPLLKESHFLPICLSRPWFIHSSWTFSYQPLPAFTEDDRLLCRDVRTDAGKARVFVWYMFAPTHYKDNVSHEVQRAKHAKTSVSGNPRSIRWHYHWNTFQDKGSIEVHKARSVIGLPLALDFCSLVLCGKCNLTLSKYSSLSAHPKEEEVGSHAVY